MTKKRWIKAEDLMAELQNDPEYLRRRAERDGRFSRLREKFARLEEPIVHALGSVGYHAESIADAVNKYAPLPEAVVNVFLANLEPSKDDRIRESLVRALGAAERPFDGTALVVCYENTSDDNLRWAIANTIALAKPHSIEGWIERAMKDPAIGKVLRTLRDKQTGC